MKFDFVTNVNEIDLKVKTDLLICNFQNEKINLSQDYLQSKMIDYLCEVSQVKSCLLFAYFTIDYVAHTNGGVAIISDGNLIDITEQGDIKNKVNISPYNTRIGNVQILIDDDIFDKSLLFALEKSNINIMLVFCRADLSNDIKTITTNLPYIAICDNKIFTSNNTL